MTGLAMGWEFTFPDYKRTALGDSVDLASMKLLKVSKCMLLMPRISILGTTYKQKGFASIFYYIYLWNRIGLL